MCQQSDNEAFCCAINIVVESRLTGTGSTIISGSAGDSSRIRVITQYCIINPEGFGKIIYFGGLCCSFYLLFFKEHGLFQMYFGC